MGWYNFYASIDLLQVYTFCEFSISRVNSTDWESYIYNTNYSKLHIVTNQCDYSDIDKVGADSQLITVTNICHTL